MTIGVVIAAFRLGHLALAVVSAPTDDPFGPVSQDPDSVRDTACKLVEASSVCEPPPPPPTFDPPNINASGGGAAGSLLGGLLWLLLIAAVVAVVIVAVRYFADRAGSGRSSADGDDDVDPDDDALLGTVIIDRSREPKGWRGEAEEHRGAGRYRDALRCRYRALVGDLARRGLLDEIPGRTTGEERRQLRVSAPNALPFFREAADLFDAAWYGHADVGAADDDRFQHLDREVLAHATMMLHRIPRSFESAQVVDEAWPR
ncbi:MAG: DUF4129 domain-containing protein [Ilumatobacteraceae bacterium]